ncbi:MAG TPA: DinB family protein [Pyrinomonadaceae bacterium]|nr:DinB family protein [Pyrinomonadaceae bacterium]
MSIDRLIGNWHEVRAGLAKEVSQIPEDRFAFRATPETRNVAEVLQHIIQSQKMLVGEVCRPETNLMRQSFADHIREYAPEVAAVSDKHGLLELLRSSMETSEASIRGCGEGLLQTMRRFDGKELSKLDFLNFAIAHEMYHRGQLTVYERLLGVEPALTRQFKKLFATAE